MAIKYKFTYKEYKDCPKATSISYIRERGKVFAYDICFTLFFFSLIFMFVEWKTIFIVLFSLIWFFYLIKFYDNFTEKMIQKEINKVKKKRLMKEVAKKCEPTWRPLKRK